MGNAQCRSDVLYQHIQNHEWDKVIERCESSPLDTTYRIPSSSEYEMHDDVSDDEILAGMYPLHEACKTPSVPVEVIRALIRANPSSLSYRTVSGLTPFHLLLCSNVNATVEHVKCFLDASPGCLFKCNVEICDEELMVVEPSPLHLACGNPNVNWDVVELMLRHAPDAALLRYVADGCTPFHYGKELVHLLLPFYNAPFLIVFTLQR